MENPNGVIPFPPSSGCARKISLELFSLWEFHEGTIRESPRNPGIVWLGRGLKDHLIPSLPWTGTIVPMGTNFSRCFQSVWKWHFQQGIFSIQLRSGIQQPWIIQTGIHPEHPKPGAWWSPSICLEGAAWMKPGKKHGEKGII